MHTLLPAFLVSVALAVLLGLLLRLYSSGTYCAVFGHNWDMEPPWSGKELRHNPTCHRCGHEPENIAITGSHKGEHRV